MNKYLVIIPTYNEKDNIPVLAGRISNKFDILFVDDNSPDGTALLVAEYRAKNSRIYLIERNKKMGLASAYITGFRFALEKNYEKIIMMDADLSHPPELLNSMVEKENDVIVGSRYIDGGAIKGWPWYRYILSIVANYYARFILQAPVRDLTGGFNCIKKKALETLHLDSIEGEGYGFIIEIKYKMWKSGCSFYELPIIFKERENGKSKISKKIIFEAIYLVVKLRCGF